MADRDAFEAELARAARRTAQRVNMPELPSKDLPRIVCTKCPAVVTVHHAEQGGKYCSMNQWFLWVECHGRHVIGVLSQSGGGPVRDVVLEDVRPWSMTDVETAFGTAEREIQVHANNAQLLQRYMAAAGLT